ncbi:MAG TPA: DinB family protein [Pyrinomonadaceae bacterium]|nr:DinB family protein [Pyrinomonadaceae bacterium]
MAMNEIGQSFIVGARAYFTEDYLPKIERSLELLTDEQIWWRANPQSNSIGNLLLHLSGNVRQWIVCSLGGAPDERDRDSEFAERHLISREELLARLKQTLSDADAALAKFDADKLLERHLIQGCDVTALAAIFHVVEHFSMHTGQIIMIAKMFAEVDLGFYDFTDATPVLKWKRAP